MSFLASSGKVLQVEKGEGEVDPTALLDSRRLSSLCAINRKLFTEIGDIDKTMLLVAKSAQEFTNVRRCTVWLIDPADDGFLIARPTQQMDDDKSVLFEDYIRIPITKGLAGWVATNQKLLHVPDAYEDERFNPEIDAQTGYNTKSVLSIPIFGTSNVFDPLTTNEEVTEQTVTVIGVMQLLNSSLIVPLAEFLGILFAEYAGIALSNCIHYRNMQVAKRRANVLLDIMTYHDKISEEDIIKVKNTINSEAFKKILSRNDTRPGVTCWTFSPRLLKKWDSICLAVWMFDDLGTRGRLKIDWDMLIRFVLFVARSYRDNPYHNWAHAISVMHFTYLLLSLCPFVDYLTPLQRDILPIAALAHDMDHRGTNNTFQQVSESDLAALYSSQGSILERHHLSQLMCLLNNNQCAILQHLSPRDYTEAADLLQHVILTTDIANHCKSMEQLKALVCKETDFTDKTNQRLLLGLMITCADLNQVTKPIHIACDISKAIYEEFYAQGDIEKQKGHTPHPMMDRDRGNAPSEQIGFINHLAMPAFEILAQIIPQTSPNLCAIELLLEHWKEINKLN